MLFVGLVVGLVAGLVVGLIIVQIVVDVIGVIVVDIVGLAVSSAAGLVGHLIANGGAIGTRVPGDVETSTSTYRLCPNTSVVDRDE